ncbi:hypothetical protein B4079_5889 [Bacillus cereus]|nr:hypothetical protein B4079_5889 [Bacillus cereus]
MLKANASLIDNWIYRRDFICDNMKCHNDRLIWRNITNWNTCNDICIWDASSVNCKAIRFKGSSIWNQVGKNNIRRTNISAICYCNGVDNILTDIYCRYSCAFLCCKNSAINLCCSRIRLIGSCNRWQARINDIMICGRSSIKNGVKCWKCSNCCLESNDCRITTRNGTDIYTSR